MTVRLRPPRSMTIGALLVAVGVVGACGSSGDTSAQAESSAADVATSTAADDQAVDPEIYRPQADADQYYFQSASGDVYCGISTVGGAGCQTTGAPLPEDSAPQLADCWFDPGGPSSGARVFGGSAAFMCFNQGVFIGPPPPAGNAPAGAAPDAGGWEILPAGSALVIDTYTCEADTAAITCRQGANGFILGPDIAQIF